MRNGHKEEEQRTKVIIGRGEQESEETVRSHIIEMYQELSSRSQGVFPAVANKIYRVPESTRKTNENAYDPQFISIGPYHHATPALQSAEKYKWFFLQKILSQHHHTSLDDYWRKLNAVEQEVRDYYEEIEMESHELIRLLLLDGCCIMGFLGILQSHEANEVGQTGNNAMIEKQVSGNYHNEMVDKAQKQEVVNEASRVSDDESGEWEDMAFVIGPELPFDQFISNTGSSDPPIHSDPPIQLWSHGYLANDVLLMENQIPFVVIQLMYDLAMGEAAAAARAPSLRSKIVEFIHRALKPYPTAISMNSDMTQSFDHLLHYCHMYFTPTQLLLHNGPTSSTIKQHEGSRNLNPFQQLLHLCYKYSEVNQQDNENRANRWRRAMDLYEVDVQFKRNERPGRSLLDINFSKGVMEIPTLIVEDNTGSFFRNILAYEQSSGRGNNYFTAYVMFMANLMSTPADVTLLAQERIIENHLGRDKEVSDLFSKLIKGVGFDFDKDNYLKPMYSRLEKHYGHRHHRWMAFLKQKHFSNPWLGISVVAAGIILVCTILQAIFAVLTYFNPPN